MRGLPPKPLFFVYSTEYLCSAMKASGTVLEHILEQDGCDVDLQNRIESYTPLHLAVRIPDAEERNAIGKFSFLFAPLAEFASTNSLPTYSLSRIIARSWSRPSRKGQVWTTAHR